MLYTKFFNKEETQQKLLKRKKRQRSGERFNTSGKNPDCTDRLSKLVTCVKMKSKKQKCKNKNSKKQPTTTKHTQHAEAEGLKSRPAGVS